MKPYTLVCWSSTGGYEVASPDSTLVCAFVGQSRYRVASDELDEGWVTRAALSVFARLRRPPEVVLR